MQPVLNSHPFSSYCQKVLVALYENATPFSTRLLDHNDPATLADWAARWPIKKFLLLVDGDRTAIEASIIIEYLDVHYPGPVRFIPADPDRAVEVRFMDRFFDNYPDPAAEDRVRRPPQTRGARSQRCRRRPRHV